MHVPRASDGGLGYTGECPRFWLDEMLEPADCVSPHSQDLPGRSWGLTFARPLRNVS